MMMINKSRLSRNWFFLLVILSACSCGKNTANSDDDEDTPVVTDDDDNSATDDDDDDDNNDSKLDCKSYADCQKEFYCNMFNRCEMLNEPVEAASSENGYGLLGEKKKADVNEDEIEPPFVEPADGSIKLKKVGLYYRHINGQKNGYCYYWQDGGASDYFYLDGDYLSIFIEDKNSIGGWVEKSVDLRNQVAYEFKIQEGKVWSIRMLDKVAVVRNRTEKENTFIDKRIGVNRINGNVNILQEKEGVSTKESIVPSDSTIIWFNDVRLNENEIDMFVFTRFDAFGEVIQQKNFQEYGFSDASAKYAVGGDSNTGKTVNILDIESLELNELPASPFVNSRPYFRRTWGDWVAFPNCNDGVPPDTHRRGYCKGATVRLYNIATNETHILHKTDGQEPLVDVEKDLVVFEERIWPDGKPYGDIMDPARVDLWAVRFNDKGEVIDKALIVGGSGSGHHQYPKLSEKYLAWHFSPDRLDTGDAGKSPYGWQGICTLPVSEIYKKLEE